MKLAARALFLVGIVMAGCETAHNVAVSSYHAVTAPVNLFRRHTNNPSQTTTTATTTTPSDVANPAQQMPTASATPRPRVAAVNTNPTPTATPRVSGSSSEKSRPSPSPPETVAEPQFPVGKPVPGKPGLVYNPFDPNGGFIDVSGYAPGSKVKDPDSQKIFIVP